MRIAVLLTAAAVLLGGGLPAADAGTSTPTLAGQTRIVVAPGAHSIEVKVPRTVHLGNGCRNLPALSSSGPPQVLIAGFSKMPMPKSGMDLILGRYGPDEGGHTFARGSDCADLTLSAGTYLLSTSAEGRGGVLQLQVPGLAGATTLAPTQRRAGQVRALPATFLPQDAGAATRSFGATATLPAKGITYVETWEQFGGVGETVFGACIYDDAQTSTTFAPGCPGGASQVSAGASPTENYLTLMDPAASPGVHGLGGFVTGHGVRAAGSVGWWLETP